MSCASHNTICARCQVTTEPEPRCKIRFGRLPSSSLIYLRFWLERAKGIEPS
jgi:hypothetical protein